MPRKTIATLEKEITDLNRQIKRLTMRNEELMNKIPVNLEKGACYWDKNEEMLVIWDGDGDVESGYYFNQGNLVYSIDDIHCDLVIKVHANGTVEEDIEFI